MRLASRQEKGDKDMSQLHEYDRFRKVINSSHATLTDLNMGHRVEMQWNISPEHIKEQVFKLVIDDDIEITLGLEELLNYTRAI